MTARPETMAAEFFAGPGEVRALARTLDWGTTPLGWPDGWSPALRIAARAMLDSPFPICLWSGPRYALVYNDAYRRILAAKHPSALGQPGSVVWAEIWDGLEQQFAQVRAGGSPVYFEDARFVMARLEGGQTEDAWFSYSLSALYDEDGSVAAVLNISPETTARVQAERALHIERARLEEVVRQAPAFMAVIRGRTHLFERVNDAYQQLIGHRDVVGKAMFDAIPEARGQGYEELLDGVLASGEPFTGRGLPVKLERTPGATLEERLIDLAMVPLTELDGTRSGIILLGTDVTEQVRSRQEIERARDRAERLHELSAALGAATTPERVADVVVAQAVAAMGATMGMLAVRTPSDTGNGEEELVSLQRTGLTSDVAASYARFPVSAEVPTATSARTGESFFLEDRASVRAAFPLIPDVFDHLGMQALATVPLAVGGEIIGAMTFGFPAPRAFPSEDRDFFLALGRQAAQVLERARLFEAERMARVRTESLQHVTSALATAQSMADVGRVFSRELTRLIGADTAWVGAVTPDGAAIEALGWSGYAEGEADGWRKLPIDAGIALTDAVSSARPQWWGSREALIDAYPSRATTIRALAQDGAAVLPILGRRAADPEPALERATNGSAATDTDVAKHAVGGIVVGFRTPQRFDTDTRAFFLALAQQCAQAMARAHAYEAEQAARLEAEAARRAAEAASQAKSQFLATMSHELRTPLNAIGGYAQLLEIGVHGPVTAEQQRSLERIQRSQRALLAVINEVLNYARVELGAVTYDLQPTLMADVVAEAMPLVEPQRVAKGLSLTVVLPSRAADLRVLADRDKLQQILLNLLSNSIKFTPEGGTVAVELHDEMDEQGRAVLRVSDTGVGIPSDKLDLIFEPFVQVGRALNNPTEGTGLGLAISRDLSRGMGGDLTVESVPGEGSTFTLTLRRAADE